MFLRRIWRFNVERTLGSQTTVGSRLSSILGLPHFSLDRFFWEPGWKETPPEEFRAKIENILNENKHGWIIDGEYRSQGGGIVSEQATDIICWDFRRTWM